ncbi:short-chain dehydrogenase [Novimethylophilus kurashikiensis]|uniref:Short-chain dehydrogenase n=1 Tax=Novimethylophilus kurashikiensis TaxID=1825523 RepID=A0A2R5FCD0_9PROT|nr:short-chain dehydrogenase [Novimethylophilus kurashikiensis]
MAVSGGIPPQSKVEDARHRAILRYSRDSSWQATFGVALLYLTNEICSELHPSLAGDYVFLGILTYSAAVSLLMSLDNFRRMLALSR